jgi:response regulator RpfG family c-di-GMP phosphodiesterase
MSQSSPLAAEWRGLPLASLSSASACQDHASQSALTVRPKPGSPPGGRPKGKLRANPKDLLEELLTNWLVLSEDWERLTDATREEILNCAEPQDLLAQLARHELLTEYQAARIENGRTHGLLINNYRVLDRLGAGGMGVVFKAENVRMRRPVAIKVLAMTHGDDARLLPRFFTEIRAIAQLQHPNIAIALDAGETCSEGLDCPAMHYLVMEYVPGQDLEEYILTEGALSATKACDIIHQIASALAEAHKHSLVHRDIKPSNIRLTPEGQAKLLDFGLARHFANRVTEPGTMLGTTEYIAPEQAQDARAVDIRADIYGLGGTLFSCLTARAPFPSQGNLPQELARRLSEPPPSVRTFRPEIPAELDAVVSRMMAIKAEDRYQTPRDVMRALLPFLRQETRDDFMPPQVQDDDLPMPGPSACTGKKTRQVLMVDDENSIRAFCRFALASDEVEYVEAPDGPTALSLIETRPFDLVLLDVEMASMSGADVLTRLREKPPWPNLKVIMCSGRCAPDEMAQLMLVGADDYLTKPFSVAQLRARVKAALRLKEAQDRSDMLNRHLLAVNSELEQTVNNRDSDLVEARNALVLALAKLVEHRETESSAHLLRLQRYCRYLAEEAVNSPIFANQIDDNFIDMLECCAPLHDIGKVGLPDHILLKPGKLTPDERVLMQAHTAIGADTLKEVARQHGFALAFLQMATDIVRSHHEHYDGSGYPDRLAGSDIPLAARIVTIGDVYDALRSRKSYKPALSHSAAFQLMTDASTGQFDPALLSAFQRCATKFEIVYRMHGD